ncbi:MAG: YgjP-like metallopeptidase domain-containing protein, partial [Clostridia bacterium]
MREFTIVRSQRRTMSLEITADLTVLVRAPHTVSTAVIRNFVDTHERWICKHLAARRAQEGAFCALSEAAIESLKARAKIYIPERVSYFSSIMGVVPSHVKITSAR